MNKRRKICRLPAGEPCQSLGKSGLCKVCMTDEARQAASARMKELHNRPEVMAARSARMKEINNRPEVKAAASARMKALWAMARDMEAGGNDHD